MVSSRRGEKGLAVIGVLAMPHENDYVLDVDVGWRQADPLADEQASGVAGREGCAVAEYRQAAQEGGDFLAGGNRRQLPGLLGVMKASVQVPVEIRRDAVQESQRGNRDGDPARAEFADSGEM